MISVSNVLCPGPSLATCQPAPADYTIGVNRAASHVRCDAWCCGDLTLIEKIDPAAGVRLDAAVIGSPLLVTTLATSDMLNGRHTPWRGEVMTFESLWADYPKEWQFTLFSTTTAIVAAARLGAKTVTLYGCDLAGDRDWDGVAAGANRTDERWKLEAGIIHRLTVVLAERGVELRRPG